MGERCRGARPCGRGGARGARGGRRNDVVRGVAGVDGDSTGSTVRVTVLRHVMLDGLEAIMRLGAWGFGPPGGAGRAERLAG